MLKQIFEPFFIKLENFLNYPKKIFYIGLAIVFFSLILDGTVWRLWGLKKQLQISKIETKELILKTKIIEDKVKKSHTLEFIEKEVRRRFELASKGDLIFIFSKDANSSK